MERALLAAFEWLIYIRGIPISWSEYVRYTLCIHSSESKEGRERP